MSNQWNQRYNYNFPTSIRFGNGVIDELGPHLTEQGLKKVLVVSDPGLTQLPVFDQVIGLMKAEGLQVVVFSEIAKNPVKSNVLRGSDVFHQNGCDSIVGFGGGASMDVARAIALKVHHSLDLFAYDDALGGDRFVTEAIPYFVTVPTTSGTGSEVGRSTVIADDVTHEKKILFSPRLMAKKVFADPSLTMGLPAFVTATTGMDALTHCVEAYLAKGFSPLCDGVALEGIRLIAESLERATHSPDLESRSNDVRRLNGGHRISKRAWNCSLTCPSPLYSRRYAPWARQCGHDSLWNGVQSLCFGYPYGDDCKNHRTEGCLRGRLHCLA
jgi:hypothetical protein